MKSKKEKILSAAKKIIAKHGYYNSSMKDIAKAAGVAQGTPYTYFKNKEEIFLELLLSMEKSIDIMLDNIMKTDDNFLSKLEQLIKKTAEYHYNDKDMMTILRREMPDPLGVGPKGKALIKNMRKRHTKKARSLFSNIKCRKELSKEFSSDEIIRICLILLFGMTKAMEQREESDPDKAADITIKCLRRIL